MNGLTTGLPPQMFAGMRIVVNTVLSVTVEDWSKVRSPGRARRRRSKHKQNITFRQEPTPQCVKIGNTLLCHPNIVEELRRRAHENNLVKERNYVND